MGKHRVLKAFKKALKEEGFLVLKESWIGPDEVNLLIRENKTDSFEMALSIKGQKAFSKSHSHK